MPFCCQDRLKVYSEYAMISLACQLKEGKHMQENTWKELETPQPTGKQSTHTSTTTINHTAQDCLVYGHDWQTTGKANEKTCLACGITGYCPGCTPIAPQNAQPFFCTRHTPQMESKVRS